MNAESGKWQYVSVFPCFIKKYCPLSLHLLENISCIGKGEYVLSHIDDPEKLFDSEDPLVRPLVVFEKKFKISSPSEVLNSKYAEIHKQPIQLDVSDIASKRFKKVYELVLTARVLFGIETGGLALTNSILQF